MESDVTGRLTTAGTVNETFEIRGVNHIAMVCADMKRTVDFYQGILGMPLIKTCDFGDGQHFFFDMGNGSSFAFMWFHDAPAPAPGVTVPADLMGDGPDVATGIGSMNHVAFDVDAARLPDYKARLEAAGVKVSPIVYHNDVAPGVGPGALHEMHESNWVTSIYFRDPDGIQLEFAGWTRAFTPEDVEHEPATAQDAARPRQAPAPA
jgi:catechol 2,3-dioxygenase-like lactoylglutathione lyase family enzyme